ncbi:MAG: T9SS type A sorting domain-containing protein [Bacteroidota bacterium]
MLRIYTVACLLFLLTCTFPPLRAQTQTTEVEIACTENFSMTTKPFNSTSSFVLSGECAPVDNNGETEITYSVNDPVLIREFDRVTGFLSGGGIAYIKWTIVGGDFIVGENEDPVEQICAGEASSIGAQNNDLCDGLGFSPIDRGPGNSSLSSTVRVRWDNTPGAEDPEVEAKLIFAETSKTKNPIIEFKDKITGEKIKFKLITKNKREFTLCKKKMKLGTNLMQINEITSTYNCAANRRDFTISDVTLYEGCLNEDEEYGYQFRIGDGAWSSLRFTNGSRQFSVGGVGSNDRVTIRVTPYYRPNFTGLQVVGLAAAENPINILIPDEVCSNFGFISPWWVTGMYDIEWSFSNGFPTSSISISSEGNIIDFVGPIPNGRYAVVITGRDNTCGDPFSFRRYFTVRTCSTTGPGGGRPPKINSFKDSLHNIVQFEIGGPQTLDLYSPGRSEETRQARTSFFYKTFRTRNEVKTLGAEESGISIFPTLLSRGQPVNVRRSGATSEFEVQVTLFDTSGRKILVQKMPTNSVETIIETNKLVPGMYFVRTTNPDQQALNKTYRIVVQ